jgi:hypothetical protein
VSRGPIFIGGLAHSGKTQVRIVLGAHPDISMTRGTHLWDRFFGRFGDLAEPRNLERCLEAMVADPGVARLQPDPRRIRHELFEGPMTYARLFGLLHRHHAERLGRRRWGDQLGGVERFADAIVAGSSSARMIHMIRDPRVDAVGPGRRWGAVGWETARWLASAQLAERNLHRYPDRYRVVRYESLMSAPADTMRDLCGFLDERFVPSMERALARIRWRGNADPAGELVRASAIAVAFVDRYARRGLQALEYPATRGRRLSTRHRMSFALASRPVNRASMTAWRLSEGRSVTRQLRG